MSADGQATTRPEQRFVFNHLQPEAFKKDGLRPYLDYRDLGIVDATNGLARAHVVRANQPSPGRSGLHKHVVDFQFVYVLKGWQRMRVEGHGELTVREGSAWIQPPEIPHDVLEFSDDFEALEIILPADFETVSLEPK